MMQELALEKELFSVTETILNRGNFLVPRTGNRPDKCGRYYIAAIHADQSGARVTANNCKKASCPHCSSLWKLQTAFDITVKMEAYSFVTGERPCRVIASVSRDEEFTLKDLQNLRKNSNGRLRRQGVTAMMNIFHPFRFQSDILSFMKARLDRGSSSGAFWNYVLSEDGIQELSENFNYVNTWRDCVDLAPHLHYMCFPGHAMVTGDKKLILHKQTGGYENEPVYELATHKDVFRETMYLLSHTGSLINAGDHKLDSFTFGGDLYGYNPLDQITPEELNLLRDQVLEFINQNRERPFVYDEDGILRFAPPPEEEKTTIREIPLSAFMVQQYECRQIILDWIRNGENPDHSRYLEEFAQQLWSDIDNKGIWACHQFLDKLESPPPSFILEGLKEDGESGTN